MIDKIILLFNIIQYLKILSAKILITFIDLEPFSKLKKI